MPLCSYLESVDQEDVRRRCLTEWDLPEAPQDYGVGPDPKDVAGGAPSRFTLIEVFSVF